MAASSALPEWSRPSAEECTRGLDEEARGWVNPDAVERLRAAVLAESSKWEAGRELLDSVAFLRRWIVARKGDVEAASRLLLRHIRWRQEECAEWFPGVPPSDDIVSGESWEGLEVRRGALQVEDLATGKVMIHGVDAEGSGIVFIFAGRHNMYETNAERTERLVVYTIERVLKGSRNGKAVVVFHFGDGFGWSAMDTTAAQYVVKILNANFPETVRTIYMVDTGFVFNTLWAVISPFLDIRTTRKIKFLGSDRGELRKNIPLDVLPLELGGEALVESDGAGGARSKASE
jgi:hypothetical protein